MPRGMPELRDDPRFSTNDLRVANRRAINAVIERRLEDGTSDHWIAKLNDAGADVMPMSIAEFTQFVATQSQKYLQIVRETGITAD